jgi:hypothetical protein
MDAISRLDQASSLDGLVAVGQRAARLIPPGRFRDALHGTWLGHPLHPMLVQAAAGTWLSASILDLSGGDDRAHSGRRAFAMCRKVKPAVRAAEVSGPRVAGAVGGCGTQAACRMGECMPCPPIAR